MTSLLMMLSMLTASQAGLKVELDRPVPVLLTAGRLKKTLNQSLTFHWKRLTLREVLDTFRGEYRISILLDRRIDPDRKLDGELKEITLHEALKSIAKSESGEVGVVGNTVYFGPPDSRNLIQVLAEKGRKDLFNKSKNHQISRERFAELARRHTIHWNDLDRPAEIVRKIAKRYKLDVIGIDRIPHDLWAAATLPSINSYNALPLVLVQFDLTYRFNDDASAIEIIPVKQEAPLNPSSSAPN